MNNKSLSILGVVAYILSVASSATDSAGNPIAPTALIVVSGIAMTVFIIWATLRLWKDAKTESSLLICSAIILFVLQIIETMTSVQNGSFLIIATNVVKVIYLIALLWSVILLWTAGKYAKPRQNGHQ